VDLTFISEFSLNLLAVSFTTANAWGSISFNVSSTLIYDLLLISSISV